MQLRAWWIVSSLGFSFLTAPLARSQDLGSSQSVSESPSAPGGAFQYQTDLFTGRFQQTIPIVVPPARQKSEPQLALQYGSSAGNGWLGVGWGLDAGYIQRETKKGSPISWNGALPAGRYEDAAGFTFGLGGQASALKSIGSGFYLPEIRRKFISFQFLGSSWIATDASGRKYYFGETAQSRLAHPGYSSGLTASGGNIFRWALSRIVDTNGNYTLFEYANHSQLYLSRVSYNGNLNAPAIPATHTIEFGLEDRTDRPFGYVSGFRIQENKRLREIAVKIGGTLVRRYELGYISSISGRSLLQSVKEFGADGVSSLPAMKFSYSQSAKKFGPLKDWGTLNSQANTGANWNTPRADDAYGVFSAVFDVDGDSIPDHVMRDEASPFTSFPSQRGTAAGLAPAAANFTWGPLDSQGNKTKTWNAISWTDSTEIVHRMMDMNGDGLPDRVMRNLAAPYDAFSVQLNNGLGFSPAQDWGPFTTDGGHSYSESDWGSPESRYQGATKAALVDMNGDGLPDRVMRRKAAPYDRFQVQINTGSGFGPMQDWKFPNYQPSDLWNWNSIYLFGTALTAATQTQLIDLNGDGLPDRVYRQKSTEVGPSGNYYGYQIPNNSHYNYFVVQFNNGSGFEAEELWPFLDKSKGQDGENWGSTAYRVNGDTVAMLADINGDGLKDRVLRKDASPFDRFQVQFNTGSGFLPLQDWTGLSSQSASASWNSIIQLTNAGETLTDFLDMNGDGLPDRVMRKYGAPYNTLKVQLNEGPFPDLLVGVENGVGGKLAISYCASGSYDNRDKDWVADPWAEGSKSLLAFPVVTVDSLSVTDGAGQSATTSYGYQGGMFDASTREFRGFYRVESRDPMGAKTVTYFHQGGGRDGGALGEFGDQGSKAKKGTPFRVESWGSDDKLYAVTLHKVDEASSLATPGSFFPFISQTTEMHYEGSGAAYGYRARAKQYQYDFTTGNLVEELSLGEVSLLSPSTHSVIDLSTGDNLRSQIVYAHISNPEILDRLQSSTLSHANPLIVAGQNKTKIKESLFNYDPRGNMLARSHWIDANNSFVTESFQYDGYGNLVQRTDGGGAVTTVSYDAAYRIFPEKSQTGPFVTKSLFDARSGKAARIVKESGLATDMEFDAFYRVTAIYRSDTPDGPPVSWKNKFFYQFGSPVNPEGSIFTPSLVITRTNDGSGGATGHESYAYFDGLGRNLQRRIQGEDGKFRVLDTRFNQRSQPEFESLPYTNTTSAYIASSATAGLTREFDPVGRESRILPPLGDASSPTGPQKISYSDGGDPWATIVEDAAGHKRKFRHDAFGKLVEIVEFTAAGQKSTKFTHDGGGNLVGIQDANGNLASIAYDSLGRKLSMQDPDSGSWVYEYDAQGRVTFQRDAKGQGTRFVYDIYGRLIQTNVYASSGALESAASYSYDQSDDPSYKVYPGQLYKIVDAEGWQKNSYDLRGRLVMSTRYVAAAGRAFTTTTEYDEADRITQFSYPQNAARLRYSYDAGMMLRKIESVTGTGAPVAFYEAQGFDDLGRLLGIRFGNGAQTNYEYFAGSKRLKRIATSSLGQGLQDLSYSYDAVNNLKSVVDAASPAECNSSLSEIQYDELDRVISFKRAGKTETFAYDAIGNLRYQSESGGANYVYGSSKPHAVTQANGVDFEYDANGAATKRGAQTLNYNARGQLSEILGSAQPVRFGYAHDGSRLWKRQGLKLSLWVGEHYEEKDGKVLLHVIADGKRIATFEPDDAGLKRHAAGAVSSSGGVLVAASFTGPIAKTFVYYHADHLGGANVLTDRDGKLLQRWAYKPFGADLAAQNPIALPITHRFTDQIQDAETGLYFYKSRYYDPILGRFLQPDRFIPELDDPQTLNRYSYANNNPLKYTDPSGHFLDFILGIVIGALIGGALSAVQAAITGGNIGDAFLKGALSGAISGIAGPAGLGLPTNFASIVGQFGAAVLQGDDPVVSAVSGIFSAFSNSFLEGGPALEIVGARPPTFGEILVSAGEELLYNAAKGAAAGALQASIAGQDVWKGAQQGALGALKVTGFRIALLGVNATVPFARDQLQSEFDRQSQNDGTGLDLQLPAEGQYHTTVGGLLKMIPNFRLTAFGTTVALSPQETQNLSMIAHELRHVSQYLTMGEGEFIKTYLQLIPEQIQMSLGWGSGDAHLYMANQPLPYGLEPKY